MTPANPDKIDIQGTAPTIQDKMHSRGTSANQDKTDSHGTTPANQDKTGSHGMPPANRDKTESQRKPPANQDKTESQRKTPANQDKTESQRKTPTNQNKTHQRKTSCNRERHLQWDLRSAANHAARGDEHGDWSDSQQEDHFARPPSDMEEDILDPDDDDADWRPLVLPSPPARRKKQGAPPLPRRLKSKEGEWQSPPTPPSSSPVEKRKRGRQPKYNIASLVCSQCSKTMSSRQAVISHLYTQHGICVPGTEHFHVAKKLAYVRKKGDELCNTTDCEFRAVGVTHTAAVKRKRTEQALEDDSSMEGNNTKQQERKSDQSTDSQSASSNSEEEASVDTARNEEEGAGDSELRAVGRRRKGLRRGRRKGTEDEGRLCEVCGASFTDRKKLYMHRQNCQSTVCQLCGREVKRIKTHMMRHQQNKRFQCPRCPKTFPFRNNLQQHLVYHNDEWPHVCEVCGMRYREKSRLNDHLRTHTGLKPYKCAQCDAAFTRSRGLRDHQRVHTGEKPYGCHVCGRKFSSTGNLAAHRRKVHKMEPLPCNHYSEKNTLWRLTQDRFAESQQKQDESTVDPALMEVKRFSAIQPSLADGQQAQYADGANPAVNKMRTFSALQCNLVDSQQTQYEDAANPAPSEVRSFDAVQHSLADSQQTPYKDIANPAPSEVRSFDAVQHSLADSQQTQYEPAATPALNSMKVSFNPMVGTLPLEYGARNVAAPEQLLGSVVLNQHFSQYPGHTLWHTKLLSSALSVVLAFFGWHTWKMWVGVMRVCPAVAKTFHVGIFAGTCWSKIFYTAWWWHLYCM